MAVSQHGKLVTLAPVAVVLMLLCAGAVQATVSCPGGQKDCYGCVNPQTDINNCGNCGVKCTAFPNALTQCSSGRCEHACKLGFRNCDGKWENGCECEPSTDVDNCGACGTKCIAPPKASAKCYKGKCEYSCLTGYKNCDGKWENGCECEPSTDVDNCGGCGVKCIAPPKASVKCYKGKCEYTCLPGYKNCDGKWENGCECQPSTDVNNCGDCGTKCIAPPKASAKCDMGKCEYTCIPGYKNCDGKWENGCECELSTDVDNCGDCGTKCIAPFRASAKCYKGKCENTCHPGYKNCDGKWENGCECEPSTDVDNCGDCGTKCIAPPKASAKCYMGKCEYTCLLGYKNCDGKWENGCECAIDTDPENCGDCNVKCNEVANAYSTCQAKQCVYTCKPGWENCDKDWENGCECYPETDPQNCGRCSSKCAEPKYYGGEASCTKGKCGNGCKKGMKYNNGKKFCEKDGDDDGKKGNRGGKDGKKGDGDDDGKRGNKGGDDRKKGKKGDDDKGSD